MGKKIEYWPTTDWRIKTPESVNFDPYVLNQVAKEIRGRLNGVNSFLVIKNGYIIFEEYYNGYDQEKKNRLMSVTKTFTSALVGIAIDKGFIKNVDQKVFDFFPEFQLKRSDYLKRKLSIKHLLTMKTGFVGTGKSMGYEPMMKRINKKKNWLNFILNLPINNSLFGKFSYNTLDSHLLSAIITKSSNISTEDFAKKHLFNHIGILDFKWSKDPQGINNGGFGIELKPRDLAKFGFLYANLGFWNNQQVVSKNWVLESTKDYAQGYGYHVWIVKIKDFNAFMAAGYGGQYLVCFPALDLIIVITSNAELGRWRNPRYFIDKLIFDLFKNN